MQPSILSRAFNMVDTRTTAYQQSKFDPLVPFNNQKPVYAEEVAATYNVTNLSNGFTVLTESQTFPSAINMGKSRLLGTAGKCLSY
jgi:hypothetical protein